MNINDTGFDFNDLLAETKDELPVKEKVVKKPAKTQAKSPAKQADISIESALSTILGGQQEQEKTLSPIPEEEPEDSAPTEKKTKKGSNKASSNSKKPSKKQKENEDLAMNRMVISQYANSRFAQRLQKLGYDLENLQGKTNEELKTLIEQIRFTVNNNSVGKGFNDFMLGLINSIEQLVAQRTRFNVRGMTQSLANDEEYLDLVEQIRLEWLSFYNIRPEIRLAFKILQTGYTCHVLNNMGVGIPQTQTVAEKTDDNKTPSDDLLAKQKQLEDMLKQVPN